MKTLAFIALMLTGCATIKTKVDAFKDGTVTCLKEDEPAAKALAESILVSALGDALSGKSATEIFDHVKSEAEDGALAQGIPVAACALDGVLADLNKFLHPERASLMARGGSDPMAEGDRVLAEFNAEHGIASIRH